MHLMHTLEHSAEEFLFTSLRVPLDILIAWQLQVVVGGAGQTLVRHCDFQGVLLCPNACLKLHSGPIWMNSSHACASFRTGQVIYSIAFERSAFHAQALRSPKEEFPFTLSHAAVGTLCAWQLQFVIGGAGQTLWDIVNCEASCLVRARALRSPLVHLEEFESYMRYILKMKNRQKSNSELPR